MFGNAVILATGGYSAARYDTVKPNLLQEFAPASVHNLPTTNGPWAIGEGVRLARAIGAELIHMDKVQIHPTGFIDPKDPTNAVKFLAPEMLRGVGAVLLNEKGERFANELGLRDYVTSQINEHCQQMELEGGKGPGPVRAFLILPEAGVDAFGRGGAGFYLSKTLLRKYSNVREFALAENLPEAQVRKTLIEYNTIASDEQHKDKFGRVVFPFTFDLDQPITVGWVTPALHYSMGGVKIDANARVLDTEGRWIRNLYAAGEVTGGVHGKNRLAGNSLLECLVFGRIAGKGAAKDL